MILVLEGENLDIIAEQLVALHIRQSDSIILVLYLALSPYHTVHFTNNYYYTVVGREGCMHGGPSTFHF
jgi:hypothetical protein